MGIIIFDRTNKGIEVSKDGAIFLGYARQVLEQASLLEERYKLQAGGKKEFSVSTQHYSFAVNAFVDLIKEFGGDNYDFSLRETQTYEIIDDVAKMRSEIGILYLNDFNRTVLKKIIKANDLEFETLFTAKPHIFVSTSNPLAGKESVTMEDLKTYPYLSFEQGEHNSFYFSEDGVIDEELNGANIVAVPLKEEGDMEIGILTHHRIRGSRMSEFYIQALQKYISWKNAEAFLI